MKIDPYVEISLSYGLSSEIDIPSFSNQSKGEGSIWMSDVPIVQMSILDYNS